MGSMIAASPNRMAIMRSMAPRFPSSRTVLATPFGVYNLDTAHKKDISTKIRGAGATDWSPAWPQLTGTVSDLAMQYSSGMLDQS